MSPSRRILADKLLAICEDRGISQGALASLLRVNQRTLNNVISYDPSDGRVFHDTRLGTVDQIAAGLGLAAWHLLNPDTTPEILEIIATYIKATPVGQAGIKIAVRIAQEEITRIESAPGAKHPKG